MELPVVYEAPPWSSTDDIPSDRSAGPPMTGPVAPASAESYRAPAPPPEIPPYDPRLPFAPSADEWPIPSMPAFSGAYSPGFPPSRVPLSQEPVATTPLSGHVLGVVTIAVGLGAAAGVYYGGPFGAVAGSLFGGAVANAYKAVAAYKSGNPAGDAEAKVSATYAVIAAALGGWVSYKFVKPRSGYERNPEAEPASGGEGAPPPKALPVKEASQAKPGLCRPRHAYPVVSKACEERP